MTIFDWLLTAEGIQFMNALIALMVAATAVLSIRTHSAAKEAKDKTEQFINNHSDATFKPPGRLIP